FGHLMHDRSWDVLELRDVPEGATSLDRMVRMAGTCGFLTAEWPAMQSPYLPLPSTPAALDAGLSSKFRGNLRRRARKLAADVGPIALERVTDRAALDAALDEGFALEAAGWKGER